MKGIILHGGYGTRLRPLTHTGPKQLLPIANKPMSQYALEDLKEAGITEIGIIIGDVYPEKVKEFYGDGKKFGVKITYIFQEKPKGISHAIRLCKDFVGDDKFVVYLGDNVLRKGLPEYVKRFESENIDAMILLCEVDDPSKFGVVELDAQKRIKKIVEKPKNPPSKLAVIGVYFLSPAIFDIIDKLKPSLRGELEITDALQLLMDDGYLITYDTVTGWWKDTGTPEDILHANQLILDTIVSRKKFVSSDSEIHGNIIIGKNTTISKDSTITGPVIIGDNCNIGPAARIGPYVSIGNNSNLIHCEIVNSIIMDGSKIEAKIHISDSIIGHDTEITIPDQQKPHRFLLGEKSQIKQ
ncbi:MAG: glucose-1-phosphate thymidylyltransferase [Nitrosopumilaceae archaeon]